MIAKNAKRVLIFFVAIIFLTFSASVFPVYAQQTQAGPMPMPQWLNNTPAGISALSIATMLYYIDQRSYELWSQDKGKYEAFLKEKAKFIRAVLRIVEPKYSWYRTAKEHKEYEESQNFSGIGIMILVPGMKDKIKKLKEVMTTVVPSFSEKDVGTEFGHALEEWLSAKNPEFKALLEEIKNPVVSEEGAFIYKVASGLPAEKAGVEAGWFIVGVDGRETKGKSLKEMVEMIRGLRGTNVRLTLRSTDGMVQKDVEITRGLISSSWIEAKMVTKTIGLMRISDFLYEDPKTGQAGIGNKFVSLIDNLKQQGMTEGLIIDLRGNPGGYMNEADEILERLLPSGYLEIYAKSRYSMNAVMFSPPEKMVPKVFKGRIVILIDGFSASASELVAISLRDYGKAIIVGEKSFGKGTIQTAAPLPDGSVLGLTTGHYLSPATATDIDGVGVIPDVEIKDNPATPEDEVVQAAIDILNTIEMLNK